MENRRHRRRQRNHLRNLILWIGLIIAPFLALLLWDEVGNLVENFQAKKKVAKQVINLTAAQEPLYVEDVNRLYNMQHLTKKQREGEFRRQVYPYSVVDGGVHSVQELRSAIWRDPVVAKHYSNFKPDRARVIEAKADRDFYVSYRIGGEIFWTKKRLKVAKGERLITDGTNFTRTRCANVLSELPQGKISPDEPAPEVLNAPLNPRSEPTPFMPPVVTGGGPLNPPSEPTPFVPPVVIGGGPLDPPSEPTPFVPPVVTGRGPLDPADGSRDSGGGGDGEGNSPVPVPEPTTILFLGSGLLGLIGYARKKFFKK
jgi:hypothetical protein